MRNIMIMISVALILTACGNLDFRTPETIHPNPGVGPEFKQFVELFEADYGMSIGNFPIVFGSQEGNVIGVCKKWSDGYRMIEIDPTYWNNMNISDARRKALIYHELGHCILNRQHDDSYINSSTYGRIPKSIMNSYLMPQLSYSDLQPYYIDELFHPGSNTTTAPMHDESDCIMHMD